MTTATRSKTTPTQRSMRLLRERGYIAVIAEKWLDVHAMKLAAAQRAGSPFPKLGSNPPGRHIDLFGFGDIEAVKPGELLIVQCTTGDNLASRITKAREQPAFPVLLTVPGVVIEFHGWRKVGKAGARKLWDCRIERFTQENRNG